MEVLIHSSYQYIQAKIIFSIMKLLRLYMDLSAWVGSEREREKMLQSHDHSIVIIVYNKFSTAISLLM